MELFEQSNRFNRICASSTLSTLPLSKRPIPLSPVSIASAPHPPYPQLAQFLCLWCEAEFQSHLRLIHPIHSMLNITGISTTIGFNRICASSTLSTKTINRLIAAQSIGFNRICASSTLSTKATVPTNTNFSLVSIASAPHPPYPRRATIQNQ